MFKTRGVKGFFNNDKRCHFGMGGLPYCIKMFVLETFQNASNADYSNHTCGRVVKLPPMSLNQDSRSVTWVVSGLR